MAAQSADDSLPKKKDLADILEELVAAFPPGCFCPPSQQTITQIENALNDLLVWSTSAPISSSLKLELQDAINAVKAQLDTNPFSCCDAIKALQALELTLSKVVSALPPGQQLHLLGLLQQLQALFVGYLACLACEPECETNGIFANPAPIIIDSTPPAPTLAIPYPSEIEVTGLCPSITKVTATLKNLTHEFPGGIDILLVGPEGQTVILMSDTGQNNPTSNVTLTFDDDAPTLLPEFNPIVSGTFKPSNYSGFGTESFPIPAPLPPYGATLSVFNGTNPNGTWKLFVVDDSPPVGGSIADGWELNITAV
ncbi:proprotein convertase P-domain-containing protein [Bacillus cereus]|uniref:proprotein convertase P-domain-containing protein n=1 Tax=Bacillus cereus TaxID=1396 RepID=UPI001145B265|nr:proprotein convertase P-domain-containing protein [Bacillus cereus]